MKSLYSVAPSFGKIGLLLEMFKGMQNTHTHTNIHTNTYTHKHTRTHEHTHTHTHTVPFFSLRRDGVS